MPNKMERFTQRARRVLSLAQEEAERLQHNYIGTEHLLLGLMREEGGVAYRTLTKLNVTYEHIEEFAKSAYTGAPRQSSQLLELSADTKQALELAVDEARRMKNPAIDTEHLLLGLTRLPDSKAMVALNQFRAYKDIIRRQMLYVLQEIRAEPPASPLESAVYVSLGSLQKMERFTQRARRVLSLAQEEAERLQHNYIGTEHLLVGLMREEGGVAGHVLRDLGVELPRVQELVERLTRASTRTTTAPLDLSPGTKKILELAVDEARRMGHHYIGTEHLLLGLVRSSEGVGIDVLRRLGISPEEVRRQTRRILQENPVQPYMPDATPSVRQTGRTFSSLHEPMKILQLIEAGQINAQQGTDMLNALRLPQDFLFSWFNQITSYVVQWRGLEKRHLKLVIKDKTTGEIQVTAQVELEKIEKDLVTLMEAIYAGKTGQIADLENDQSRIELSIEPDEPTKADDDEKT